VTELTIQEKAHEWGGHLYWEVKQLCQLGVRLEHLRRAHKIELDDALDAAGLESFVLHARSLIDFLWLSSEADVRKARARATEHGRKIVGKAPLPRDVLAEYYFVAPADWHPGAMSKLLEVTHLKAGWGIAHCSLKRLDLEEVRGWEHAQITRELAGTLIFFTRQARSHHLDQRHAMEIERECGNALAALPFRPVDRKEFVGTPVLWPATPMAAPPMRSVYSPPPGVTPR
jgi:hypothetical protein